MDTFCSTLLNNWPEREDAFVFVCNASHPGQEELRESITRPCQFEFHSIHLSWVLSKRLFCKLPSSLRRTSQPFLRIILYLYQMRALRAMFQRIGGDALIVVNGGFPGGETCRLANIAWVSLGRPAGIHNFHSTAVQSRWLFRLYENWIDRKTAAATRYFVGVSRVAAESLRVRVIFRCSTKIRYIYNGIQIASKWKNDVPNIRGEFGVGDKPLCLMLANYEPWKGHHFLFEAFKIVAEQVPDVHLVLCGGSPDGMVYVDRLRREIAPTVNIHLLGFISGGDRLIEQADLLVISSQVFESFGLTAVEAMLVGVPVVSTRVGGLPEVIGEDGNGGYTVAPDDPAAFAARIVRLLRDPKLRRQVGEQGRKRASLLFTADRMAAEYQAVLVSGADPVGPSVVPSLRGEWYYVLRRCCKPRMALESVAVVVSALRRRFGNRVLRRREIYYPPQIKSLAAAVPILATRHEFTADVYPTSLPDGPRRLKLATGYLDFDGWPKWDSPFRDHEQFVSLHRWNWLLRALTDEANPAGFSWGIALIRSWLVTMTTLPGGDVGESYSTGERIVNACLFARHTTGRWNSLPVDIANALASMAADLAHRVEYHEGELSGNHVINNGRALLFAGHCFARPELLVLGRALIIERLPALISDGVFLREGSSHYQFLFTRWLLELRLLAEEHGDTETRALIAPYLPGLVEGCRFFQVTAADGGFIMPTLGDISPDCDPAWLLDLPESPLVCLNRAVIGQTSNLHGWAMLFSDSVLANLEVPLQEEVDTLFWRSYQQAGWYRLDFKGWVAIWRTELPGGPTIASHAHHDGCSCVLYRHGKEVLIDPGRLDYGDGPLGRYGSSGDAHNSVTLNGRPPLLSRGDRLIPERHRQANCVISCEELDGMVRVSIEHDGFARLGGGVERHSRSFTFSADQLDIVDRFDGHGLYWMEARFHRPLADFNRIPSGFYPRLPENFESDISLQTLEALPDLRESSLVACSHPIGGWRFPGYGIKSAALTQRFVGTLALPVECRYRIIDNNG